MKPLFHQNGPSLKRTARLEFVQIRHAPQDCGPSQPVRQLCAWEITPEGDCATIPARDCKHRGATGHAGLPPSGRNNAGWAFLAYGQRILAHEGTDSFDFTPLHRLRRFASLWDNQARLTDPVAFLQRLHLKGVTYVRPRTLAVLARLTQEVGPWLGVGVKAWLAKNYDFTSAWRRVSETKQQAAIVMLDATRHCFDASSRFYNPLELPGVLLLDRPDRWCPPSLLARFLQLLDRLFPRMQFFVRLSRSARVGVPPALLANTLPVPQSRPPPAAPRPVRLPREAVLLLDVDSTLPNLALMKLSRHFKAQGKRVALVRMNSPTIPLPKAETVYASCVFATAPSARRVAAARRHYGAALQLGGSGVALELRLPPAIETLPADYTLYPELRDRALGFLTRGCPMHCPFCVVPAKEGRPHQVADLETLLQGRKKLILLDDNLLAHPKAVEFLGEMARRDLEVNFNQTLDLRLLTAETAALLRRIRCSNVTFTRRNYYFSLNETRNLDLLRERYALLQTQGRDNAAFVFMYGFNTTLAEDVRRLQFLRTLPGAYVFTQRYLPVPGAPAPDLRDFFDDRADERINALLRVNFRQNMKSMEVYYRWVCLLYAQQRGRIHHRLVATLYRYNRRHCMGGFLAKLDTLCREERTAAVS